MPYETRSTTHHWVNPLQTLADWVTNYYSEKRKEGIINQKLAQLEEHNKRQNALSAAQSLSKMAENYNIDPSIIGALLSQGTGQEINIPKYDFKIPEELPTGQVPAEREDITSMGRPSPQAISQPQQMEQPQSRYSLGIPQLSTSPQASAPAPSPTFPQKEGGAGADFPDYIKAMKPPPLQNFEAQHLRYIKETKGFLTPKDVAQARKEALTEYKGKWDAYNFEVRQYHKSQMDYDRQLKLQTQRQGFETQQKERERREKGIDRIRKEAHDIELMKERDKLSKERIRLAASLSEARANNRVKDASKIVVDYYDKRKKDITDQLKGAAADIMISPEKRKKLVGTLNQIEKDRTWALAQIKAGGALGTENLLKEYPEMWESTQEEEDTNAISQEDIDATIRGLLGK